MTVTRAEQVQSRGNEGKRALSVPRPWATGASALRPMSGQRINCLGDWIGRGGKDRNRAQETAWEALLSAPRRPQGRHRARQSPPASLPLARGRENPWGSGRTGAWSQRRLPEISRSFDARPMTSRSATAIVPPHDHKTLRQRECRRLPAQPPQPAMAERRASWSNRAQGGGPRPHRPSAARRTAHP